MRRTLPAVTAAIFVAVFSTSCLRDKTHQGGCLANAPGCTLPTPCETLAFTCTDTSLSVRQIGQEDPRPVGGWEAQAAQGDWLLSNGKVSVVISDLGHQYHLAPNGGSIIDLAVAGMANDAINEIFQASGWLPEDSVRYTELKKIEEPGRVAIQVNGHLDGRPDVRVHTIYELHACDPGVRVRSELVNESPDTHLLFLGDAYFWGNHTAPAPFSPTPGAGFEHPPVKLTSLNEIYRQFPFLAANQHTVTPDGSPNAAYSAVACNQKTFEGMHSIAVSAAATPRSIVASRDSTVLERFISVVPGEDIRAGADQALELRKTLFGEDYVTLSGHVTAPGGVGQEREASIEISEGTAAMDASKRTPWTQVVPDASGNWSARVPKGKAYVVDVNAFGRSAVTRDVPTANADVATGDYTLPTTTPFTLTVEDFDNGNPVYAELMVVAQDDTVPTEGSFHGAYEKCNAYLGSPGGPNPSCNRALITPDAPLTLELAPGRYHVYAFKSMFWSLDELNVVSDGTPIPNHTFRLHEFPKPAALQSDMHIHGAASHDSTMPDDERAISFAAADLDVAIATDHDVVYDYKPAMVARGLDSRIETIVGVESTNWIPFFHLPGYPYPLTLGHSNFWPLRYDPTAPRNGGPYDEYKEPGAIYDELESRQVFTTDTEIVQLNHPLAGAEFGRDLGFARAIFFDTLKPLPTQDDQSGNWVFVRKPNGKRGNADHQAQEVMNGTFNGSLLPYRHFWFYLLNQGLLRTGTANSDSHYLSDSTIGMPRSLVYAATSPGGGFNMEVFNQAIRDGRVQGTNGPLIDAFIDRDGGGLAGFGLAPFKPATDAKLHLLVRAAPWVDVEEIRVIVNGRTVSAFPPSEFPTDPTSTNDLATIRYASTVDLGGLLNGVTGDAWIVVEAGRKLLPAADFGGGLNGTLDGIPDTTDNNGDGVVNDADRAVAGKPGPITNPPAPSDPTDPGYAYARITSGGYPYAFTNPFILDRDGNGTFEAPGLNGGFNP